MVQGASTSPLEWGLSSPVGVVAADRVVDGTREEPVVAGGTPMQAQVAGDKEQVDGIPRAVLVVEGEPPDKEQADGTHRAVLVAEGEPPDKEQVDGTLRVVQAAGETPRTPDKEVVG